LKRIPKELAALKTFEYRTTEAFFQNWKDIHRDERRARPTKTMDNTGNV
jgi:hypothetical protein